YWSAIALAGFLVVHLGHVFIPALQGDDVALYERLRHDLSHAGFVAVYIVGIAAACLHFAQGIEAASMGLAKRWGQKAVGWARAIGFITAILLFAVAIN